MYSRQIQQTLKNDQTRVERELGETINVKNSIKSFGAALINSLTLETRMAIYNEVTPLYSGRDQYCNMIRDGNIDGSYHSAAYILPLVILTNKEELKIWSKTQLQSGRNLDNHPFQAKTVDYEYDKKIWKIEDPNAELTDKDQEYLMHCAQNFKEYRNINDDIIKSIAETEDIKSLVDCLKMQCAWLLEHKNLRGFWADTKQDAIGSEKTYLEIFTSYFAVNQYVDNIGINRVLVQKANMGTYINLVLPEVQAPSTAVPPAARAWWSGVSTEEKGTYPLLSGPSGNSFRIMLMMEDVKRNSGSQWKNWFNTGQLNLDNFYNKLLLLFIAAYVTPINHHSYYEIMTAAHGIGGIEFEEDAKYGWAEIALGSIR